MVLHIANDFNLTKVHRELYYNLDKKGISQKIFIPLRSQQQIGNNHFTFNQNDSEYIYSETLKKYHKFFFGRKIDYLYNSVISKINHSGIKLTHATTLFSDGAIAYKLFEKFGIPYIVAVRNTDLNIHFKYRKNLIPLGKKILLNAKKIIFISESNKEAFYQISSLQSIIGQIEPKIQVINNGIDNFWLDDISKYNCEMVNSYNFLFIGRFDSNKNTAILVEALDKVREEEKIGIELNIIGGTGNKHNSVLKKIDGKPWIHYHGQIFDKKELKRHFLSNNYFSMISHTETFGLVYMEALSQGLPVLYTKGQGIDKAFTFQIGESVDSKDLRNIVQGIKKIISNQYNSINSIDFENFRWSNIALKYIKIYNE